MLTLTVLNKALYWTNLCYIKMIITFMSNSLMTLLSVTKLSTYITWYMMGNERTSSYILILQGTFCNSAYKQECWSISASSWKCQLPTYSIYRHIIAVLRYSVYLICLSYPLSYHKGLFQFIGSLDTRSVSHLFFGCITHYLYISEYFNAMYVIILLCW